MERPRNLLDIRTRKVSAFSRLTKRVELYRAKQHWLPFRIPLAGLVSVTVVLTSLAGFVIAPTHPTRSLAASTVTQPEREALEKELADLLKQADEYSQTIAGYQQQGSNLKSEINKLNAKINKVNLQIKAVTLSLEKLNQDIEENQDQIISTEEQIVRHRGAIGDALQSVYESDKASLLSVLLKNPNLSDFFGDVNNLLDVQTNLVAAVSRITELKNDLIAEKEELELKRNDAAALKAYQDAQRLAALSTKKQKDELLALTKGQESKYQELLKKTKETAAEIRSRIFEFLGGGEMTFEDAYRYAKLAEQATGVEAAFVLAVLDHESALGQNVGRCNYKTAMSPGIPARPGRRDDISIFLTLVAELGISPDSVTVSCANRDGAFGGAMGPAQFIPTTWNLYRARISNFTGNKPPSPWRNGDAIVATSLYLQDAMSACSAYSGAAQKRCMGARYYAGSRWKTYLWTYGERVVSKAQQFQQDIDVLNANGA